MNTSAADRLKGFDGPHAARAWSTLRQLDAPDVVVLGAGIAGTQLAARLSRRGAKVALVTGGALPPRRLIDGCSLRRGTLQTMAEAMGVDELRLAGALGASRAQFSALRISATQSVEPTAAPQLESHDGSGAPIGLSARHADILCALRQLVPNDVALVPADVLGYVEEQHRLKLDLAEGGACDWPLSPRTTIVNTQSRRVGGPARDAARWVIAAQQPIALAPESLPQMAWAPSFRGAHGWHLAFVTPFWDSATPDANGYAIDTLIVDEATLQSVGKEALLADVRTGLARCVAALGATAIDPETTTGAAAVPVVEDFAPVLTGGLVDLSAALSSGAPAINVDGMLAQSIGIAALCRALPEVLGEEQEWLVAAKALVPALAEIRKGNRMAQTMYFSAPYWVRRATHATLSLMKKRVVRQWADLGR